MTLDQFGVISNIVGLVIPLLLSISIARSYKIPYFANWVKSYWFFLATILSFLVPETPATLMAHSILRVGCMQLGTWYLLRTAETLNGHTGKTTVLRRVWVATLALSTALALFGLPFTIVSIAPALLMIAAHLKMAAELFKLPHARVFDTNHRLGALVAAVGLWTLSFSILGGTPYVWAGFVVSGALHLFVGVEMVIFLLEDVARILSAKNEELQQLDRLKSNFISTMSHELRTPLNAIKSASWLMTHRRDKSDEAEMLTIIDNQVEALQTLIADVLDFSKMESGALSYSLELQPLNHLARAVVHDLTPQFTVKGIELALEAPPSPLPVRMDANRMAQVMRNLLSNALKFTPPGGKVTLRVGVQDGQARVEVQDTGPGIPAENREQIFKRFYQIDNTSTRKSGGAGLGLAISRAIVEEGHGGRIWVESTPGQGSRFIITLPLPPATAELAPSMKSGRPGPGQDG